MNTRQNTPEQTLAARNALLADPRRLSAEVEITLRHDPALQQFRQQLLDRDAQVAQAFDEVVPPTGLAERIILGTRYRRRSRWMAGVAASVLVAVLAVFMLRPPPQPQSALAVAMIDYVIEFKYELDDDGTVAPDIVEASLAALGVQYRDLGYRVRHLANCVVAGRVGRHLVMNTPAGIVSFMILPDLGGELSVRQKLGKAQFHAVFVPQPRTAYGAIAEQSVSVAELERLMSKIFVPLQKQT